MRASCGKERALSHPLYKLSQLSADEVQPLLDLNEAVVQLVESLAGPAE